MLHTEHLNNDYRLLNSLDNKLHSSTRMISMDRMLPKCYIVIVCVCSLIHTYSCMYTRSTVPKVPACQAASYPAGLLTVVILSPSLSLILVLICSFAPSLSIWFILFRLCFAFLYMVGDLAGKFQAT